MMPNHKPMGDLLCPLSHQSLASAPAELLDRLNTAIRQGLIVNHAGRPVRAPLGGGLLREDGSLIYPIADGIPVMLGDESIALDQLRMESP